MDDASLAPAVAARDAAPPADPAPPASDPAVLPLRVGRLMLPLRSSTTWSVRKDLVPADCQEWLEQGPPSDGQSSPPLHAVRVRFVRLAEDGAVVSLLGDVELRPSGIEGTARWVPAGTLDEDAGPQDVQVLRTRFLQWAALETDTFYAPRFALVRQWDGTTDCDEIVLLMAWCLCANGRDKRRDEKRQAFLDTRTRSGRIALVEEWVNARLAHPILRDSLVLPRSWVVAPPHAVAGPMVCIAPQGAPPQEGWSGIGTRSMVKPVKDRGDQLWVQGLERVSVTIVRRERGLVARWQSAPWTGGADTDVLAAAAQRSLLDWYQPTEEAGRTSRARVAAWRPGIPVDVMLSTSLFMLSDVTRDDERVGRLFAADADEALAGIAEWLDAQAPANPDQVLVRSLTHLSLPEAVRTRVDQEVRMLANAAPYGMDRAHILDFLRVVEDLPWDGEVEAPTHTLAEARATLDREHAGMREVKQHVLDQLVSLLWWGKRKAAAPDGLVAPPTLQPILLVGPPGTGKTTILRSIGEALGRRAEVVSCGGFSDSSALTGFERGYVSARPGAILDAVRRARTRTLLLGLDEIDKMTANWRGDPFAVLMELTDPAQNTEFVDRFLQVPFDMSRVLVVATANEPDRIPPALRDRFRIVEIRGYSPDEKLAMAKGHILPRVRADIGVEEDLLRIDDDTLRVLIEEYTFESGVRGLTDAIRTTVQRALPELLENQQVVTVDPDRARALLRKRAQLERPPLSGAPGYGTVLTVYTGVGIGMVSGFEVSLTQGGTGALTVSGTVNDEIRETVAVALAYLRVHAAELGFDAAVTRQCDIQVHQDRIGVSKGGPSAGVASVLVLLSAFRGVPLREGLVATGEVTLDGRVLVVGGIPEKVIAAHRAGARTVLVPAGNEVDLDDIPPDVRRDVQIILVAHVDQAIAAALPAVDGAPAGGG